MTETLFINNEEIYWSFWGQLCYIKSHKSAALNILHLTEHSLCIYFATMVEYLDNSIQRAMDNYSDTLDKRAITNPGAYELGKDECVQCGGCCWTWPCSLTQEEAEKIADYLNIPTEVFMEHYTVINNGIRTIRRHEWEDIANKTLDGERLYDINTPCVFFDDTTRNCKIHSVKPLEGKECRCWEEEKAFRHGINMLKQKYSKKMQNLLDALEQGT
ncbi:MAG: YkgJ family cysteine cluster protein [Candidatus Eremiobacterota bacterium]